MPDNSFHFEFKEQPDKISFERFLAYCAKNEVSDILIQANSKIWVERHGRQICCSKFRVLTNVLDNIISQLWGDYVRPALRQGDIINTTHELKGKEAEADNNSDDLGLEKGEIVRFRVNFTQATINSVPAVVSVSLRVLNSHIPALTDMSIETDLFDNLLPGAGMGLIGGATGAGKSLLCAATLQYCGCTYKDRKIITLESPVEYLLGGKQWIAPEPAQSEVGRDVPSFAEGVGLSALRRAPKIILIGELLEVKAFEAALTASQSGHFTMGTLHISTVGEVFPRSLLLFPEEYRESMAFSLLTALKYVIVQKLIPTLDGKRVAVREYVVFDRDLKNLLLNNHYSRWREILDNILIKNGASLVQKAFALFCEGVISQEEMIKVAGTKRDFDKLENGEYGREP